MGGHQTIDVRLEPAFAGWRLDRALAAAVPTLSRERLKALIRSGAVETEGSAVRDPATKVKGDEQLSIAKEARSSRPSGALLFRCKSNTPARFRWSRRRSFS